MIHLLKYILFLVFFCALTACSTKKSTFFSRAFHNTTTHYNWYFNGEETLKSSVKKLEENTKKITTNYYQYSIGTKRRTEYNTLIRQSNKERAKAISRHSILLRENITGGLMIVI